MEAQTTEVLFAALSPEAREEAVRLAARFQDRGDEGAHLVAAAREAGITDSHLREAAMRLAGVGVVQVASAEMREPHRERAMPVMVSADAMFVVLIATAQAFQIWYVAMRSSLEVCLPLLLLTVLLGAGIRRVGNWWSGFAAIGAVWSLYLLPMLLTSGNLGFSGGHTPRESIAGFSLLYNLLAVGIGVVLSLTFSALRMKRTASTSVQI